MKKRTSSYWNQLLQTGKSSLLLSIFSFIDLIKILIVLRIIL